MSISAPTSSRWSTVPLGRLFRRIQRTPRPADGVVTAFRDGQVALRSRRRTDGFTEAIQEIGYQGIRRGDLVIHAMDAFAGAIGVSEDDGKSSPVYTVLIPSSTVDPRFYAYVLRNFAKGGGIQALAQGIRERSTDFRWAVAKTVPVPFPRLEEQAAIADYLDRETAEIDAFIGELGKLSALTMERLRSEAAELLTPPSEIASGWISAHLGPLISITAGQVDPQKDPYRDMPLIAPNHIESRTSRLLGLETAREQGADSGKYFAKEGQVLFSKIRPTLMKSTLAPADCLTSADMYPIDANPRFLTNAFLLEYLLGPQFEDFAARESARVAMPKLNRETLSAALISLPPLEHQHLVVRKMQESRLYAREHLTEIETARRLGQERRSSLISAAVTGQIDVTTQGVSAAEQLRDELEVYV